ncbi:MAG: pitrilysin family protein [Pseudomonadota bacterium]
MKALLKSITLPAVVLALSAATLVVASPAHAVDIQTVTSSKGVKALLVEDYAVPLVSFSFSFKGGSTQDAEGKEGTANLLSSMLDEGAGDLDSKAFQEALDDNGMEYRFSSGVDSFSGSLRTVVDVSDRSFELMAAMINQPRFDVEPIERIKVALGNRIESAKSNPNALVTKLWRETIFKDHPYERPPTGTKETLAAITAEDLEDYRKRIFARDNLVIGVVGAISADQLKTVLDKIFGDLPEESQRVDVPELVFTAADANRTVHMDFATPQTNIRLALPGLKRDDPDFFAAYLVNYVLGGGSFSSRFFKEVREKRGLAYGVYSYMATFDSAGLVGGGSATQADRAQTTIDVLREEIARMGRDGPTQEEFDQAKAYIVGSYPISNLDTSGKIASVLVAIQTADLGIDYIDKRAEYLNAVTLEDAKRVAKELFSTPPLVVTVGQKPQG